MSFYKFGKKNNCQVIWGDYDFNLKEIVLKFYNKDKTGFTYISMTGKTREELFKKESLEDLSKEQLIQKVKELQGN